MRNATNVSGEGRKVDIGGEEKRSIQEAIDWDMAGDDEMIVNKMRSIRCVEKQLINSGGYRLIALI